ncbi:DUF2637 domain-containing protein [Nocardia vinacea]|uniref:DUF2637 domain-containing protein n=1 Tax=Nocardia vinacea TaxID=96468 RepID=UPI002E139A3D|nr:DUF2637 domain-containing protein [Nocardia vinacea]
MRTRDSSGRCSPVAAAVSITGNAAHAVLHADTQPAVAAAFAVVPPLAVLAAVHGITILLCAHARARLAHLLATLMTLMIAAGAFLLSFTALRELAVSAAVPQQLAWLWPVIVEGSMTESSNHRPARTRPPATLTRTAHPQRPLRPTKSQPAQPLPNPAPTQRSLVHTVTRPRARRRPTTCAHSHSIARLRNGHG